MLTVLEVEARPGYKLVLRFSDGTHGVVAFQPMIENRRFFQTLRDEKLFGSAYVDHGVVTWPGGIDIATEMLYAMAHDLPNPSTLEQAIANEAAICVIHALVYVQGKHYIAQCLEYDIGAQATSMDELFKSLERSPDVRRREGRAPAF